MIKKYRFLFISAVFLVIAYIMYETMLSYQFKNIKHSSPEFTISTSELTNEFNTNEELANKEYIDKVIEVYGKIKKISTLNNRRTIILESKNAINIICDLDDTEKTDINTLKINQQLYIKGICKGYLKDVILLNCFIVTHRNHE